MTAAPAFSLCVYCGSRLGAEPCYAQLAEQVGHWIGRHGGQLVYGGGNAGLMGAVASATLAAGGRVVGVIPQSLVAREFAKHDCTELHVVASMHERKRLMAERADAFLALPGGLGTLEELFEVWTWRQLGYHAKPIGVLNANGYWDGLLAFLRQTHAAGFVGEEQLALVDVGDHPETLLPRLVQAAGWVDAADLRAI
ncbi:Cytokinin riboside 5'-monophosphate phosphoribohydrolase [Tepidimonas alkaliphilus]|uniref:Cytokinin riboside 5'-monophosphate phosphoribohydrolase n=1 Tax=Tepidimonas alkaliphilus TaxID=2588942 RepID=A0A554WDM0_9BURK|nr:TIGR00730 family Rossman fold protein [Tepidimonas alkaliphilus]TSE21652.1 Cytokinin riboside 5'-monophosphate phosphoribohydrolase [Tepidimonas alkaliphilus]